MVVSGVLAPLVGTLCDISGPRRVFIVGAALGAAGLAAFSRATEGWQVIVAWLLLLGPAMAATFYERSAPRLSPTIARSNSPRRRGRPDGRPALSPGPSRDYAGSSKGPLAIARQDPCELLERHQVGDWSEVPAEDAKENGLFVREGLRIVSAYSVGDGQVWLITEADPFSTCFLPPMSTDNPHQRSPCLRPTATSGANAYCNWAGTDRDAPDQVNARIAQIACK